MKKKQKWIIPTIVLFLIISVAAFFVVRTQTTGLGTDQLEFSDFIVPKYANSECKVDRTFAGQSSSTFELPEGGSKLSCEVDGQKGIFESCKVVITGSTGAALFLDDNLIVYRKCNARGCQPEIVVGYHYFRSTLNKVLEINLLSDEYLDLEYWDGTITLKKDTLIAGLQFHYVFGGKYYMIIRTPDGEAWSGKQYSAWGCDLGLIQSRVPDSFIGGLIEIVSAPDKTPTKDLSIQREGYVNNWITKFVIETIYSRDYDMNDGTYCVALGHDRTIRKIETITYKYGGQTRTAKMLGRVIREGLECCPTEEQDMGGGRIRICENFYWKIIDTEEKECNYDVECFGNRPIIDTTTMQECRWECVSNKCQIDQSSCRSLECIDDSDCADDEICKNGKCEKIVYPDPPKPKPDDNCDPIWSIFGFTIIPNLSRGCISWWLPFILVVTTLGSFATGYFVYSFANKRNKKAKTLNAIAGILFALGIGLLIYIYWWCILIVLALIIILKIILK